MSGVRAEIVESGAPSAVDTADPSAPFDVRAWSRNLIHGCGGLLDYEHYEVVVWEDRDAGIVDFVLRALANPKCEGSAEVLAAIAVRRASAGCDTA